MSLLPNEVLTYAGDLNKDGEGKKKRDLKVKGAGGRG